MDERGPTATILDWAELGEGDREAREQGKKDVRSKEDGPAWGTRKCFLETAACV